MQSNFLTVGIGASAGGIQALKRFFAGVPAESGACYVIVLHLSPEHESRLAEVLQTSAAIPVRQVRERVMVQPNHAYVIAPDRTLSMQDGYLDVSEVRGYEQRHAPIDMFFRTMADAQRGQAVSVILSGTGADGSMGLKRVKERGGICLVQAPEEAEHADMPRHAIATALVDDVLPVAEMPARIIAYGQSSRLVRLPDSPATGRTAEEQALRDLFCQLRSRTGHDFSNYKRATVLRRIARRMSLHDVPDLAGYVKVFRDRPDEAPALLKDLLISVTNFFRDRDAFAALERIVLPRLLQGKNEDDQLRVWVAGCASGEEAYSIAMLLAEHVGSGPGTPGVQIFATDIDAGALAIAREGVYTINDAADVSPERLRRFFTKEGERYRVRKELREMILFAQHNIIKDPPFSHLDLVSCRNLLIYLNRVAQRRVMEVIHFALNGHGCLFLGMAESIDGAGDLFTPLDKAAHIFQSRGTGARGITPVLDVARTTRGKPARPTAFPREPAGGRPTRGELHQRLLEQYAPPSILVNEEYDILHISERAGRYLQYAGGEPSHNLLRVIRPALRIDVRTALYQAAHDRTNREVRGLSLTLDDRAVTIDVIIKPVLRQDDPARGFFLILFQEVTPPDALAIRETATLSRSDAAHQLEDELQQLKAQVRATAEQHESQSEEFKASNEELQSMNEELRSSAEELEASREELQSLNEELRTVNQELKIKIEEQAQAADDIQNLINSTEIGTIFLDRSSCIKLFTPRARDIFTLIAADRGRPLWDISSSLVDIELQRDIEHVLDQLGRIEREVKTRDGRWHLMRVLPYRTADDRIDGSVLTFLDVTERRKAEDARREAQERLRLVVESVPDYAIFTLDADGRIYSWNSGAGRMFGYTEGEVVGRSGAIVFTADDREAGAPQDELRTAREAGRAIDERWLVRKDGTRFYASGAVVPLRDGGTISGFVKIAHDLTERKRWEDTLQQAHTELEARVLERTRELNAVNQALDEELRERQQAEEQIRSLLARLITVQEDERRRIARDLHDQIGQELAGLSLKIDGLRVRLTHATADLDVPAAIDELRDIIARLDGQLDFFAWELRPAALDDFGLVVSLDHFVREWSQQFGVTADFHSRGLDALRLRPEVETNLYRIVQEALNNVHKHAHARHVGVLLERRNHEVVLVVEDNGVGFDLAAPSMAAARETGLGLIGMRERAALAGGTLDVESEPDKGTTVFARVPLPAGAAAPAGR